MIHLRVDNEPTNAHRRFACGIGPELPEGDTYFFVDSLSHHHLVDCPVCVNVTGARQLGTPISHLSGRPGHPGYEEFCRIARTWGYE
jgi:hypothetical protein